MRSSLSADLLPLTSAAATTRPATARRVVFAHPIPSTLTTELDTAAQEFGGRVIVRSSSPLESDLRWSGAFSSIGEVGPGEVGVAVRSCWASVLAPDPLARAEAAGIGLDRLDLAVLLQPELTPTAGGTARLVGDEVEVTAVPGHPGALLAGWATGETRLVAPGLASNQDGRYAAVARLAGQVADDLGCDVIEWAAVGEAVFLLQASRAGTGRRTPLGPAGTGGAPPQTEQVSLRPAGTDGARHVWGQVSKEAGNTLPRREVRAHQSVPGDAVGWLRYIRPHQPPPADLLSVPHILVCERPVPALAPLLFGARGLVSLTGPAECHLVEVARALGVPCLVDAAVAHLTGPPQHLNTGGWLAAIDGARNALVVLRSGAGERSDDLPQTFRRIATVPTAV